MQEEQLAVELWTLLSHFLLHHFSGSITPLQLLKLMGIYSVTKKNSEIHVPFNIDQSKI